MDRRRSPNGQSEESGAAESPRSLADDTAGGAPAAVDLAAAWPTGRQTLNSKGRALRRGLCPTHHKIARRFLGVNAGGWVFACPYGPHNFTVPPDPSTPQTPYEAAAAAVWAKANPRR